MFCPQCASGNQAELSAEMMIHFSGLKNLDKPGLLVFPRFSSAWIVVFLGFTVPETELALLRIGSTIDPSIEGR